MSYSADQRRNISLALALSRGYGPRVRKSLLEAMAVESSFRNLPYGDRDSQGVLQQRPSQGWGAPGNVAQDIRQYLQRAGALVQSGFRGTAGQLAQAVQHSAFPGRYDQRRGEVAALLGGAGAGGPGPSPQMTPASGAGSGDPRAAVLQQLIASSQQRNPTYQGLISALGQLGAARSSAPETPSPGAPPHPRPGVSAGGGITELFYDPLGAIKNGHEIPAIGGHSDHVHFSAASPQQMLAAINEARGLGLHVGENPYVGRVDPVHVQGSYHYRTFAGRYHGRKLGEAIDVSGDPRQMARFYRWVASRFR